MPFYGSTVPVTTESVLLLFSFPTENMALPLNKRLVVVKPGDMQINIFLQWMMTSWVLEVEQKIFFFANVKLVEKVQNTLAYKTVGILL